jgi:hypothetical protein
MIVALKFLLRKMALLKSINSIQFRLTIKQLEHRIPQLNTNMNQLNQSASRLKHTEWVGIRVMTKEPLKTGMTLCFLEEENNFSPPMLLDWKNNLSPPCY